MVGRNINMGPTLPCVAALPEEAAAIPKAVSRVFDGVIDASLVECAR